MLTEEEYKKLYHKRISGHCTEDELQLLELHEKDFMMKEMSWDEQGMGEMETVKDRIHSALARKINAQKGPARRTLLPLRYAAAVAAILIITTFLTIQHFFYKEPELLTETSKDIILPGGNKALLTLDDGTVVDLGAAHLGDIRAQGHVLTNKEQDGKLNYGTLSQKSTDRAAFHTVRTPRGGQYQITLADGTQVWLNAASSIRFPTHFDGAERVVEIEGEVFFDVKRLVHNPFKVVAQKQIITVLGTQFNVSAYQEESVIQTSLIQGKVRLDVESNYYDLVPGQATVYDQNNAKVKKIIFDERSVLAWQKGYFMFNDEPIEKIMQKIERWYDVQVVFEGDMRSQAFSGKISRFNNVQDVLDMLALTGTVKFKIEGRRIYVMA